MSATYKLKLPLKLAPLADSVDEALATLFGFDSFRPGQREAIELVQSGKDALIVMPTGAGKSLCFQLPAFVRPGVTLVVSPLVALMKDQVDAMQQLDLPVTYINSTLTDRERAERQNAIAAGDYKLVYVAPERFRSPTWRAAIERSRVSLMVVDEAHCVSQWGHDFRPDYLRLAEARQSLGDPQLVALTATATSAVQRDVVRQLAMREPRVLVSGFERPNLYFEVRRTFSSDDKLRELTRVIDQYPQSSMIVYCATRKQVESTAEALEEEGYRAGIYHAGLNTPVRTSCQEAWMAGEFDVLVATNAFGMGVDKANVRAIVHWKIPGSLEAYYQEAGRAGRDGEPASCVVLYGCGDRGIRDFFNENTYPPRHRVEMVWKWLLEQGASQIYFDLDQTAREVGEIGDRLHPMGFRRVLWLLRRAGHIARYSTSKGKTEVVLADRAPVSSLRIDWKSHHLRRQIVFQQLEDMVEFAESRQCLQANLVRHFNAEPSFGMRCEHCANCVPFPPQERGEPAPSKPVSAETARLVRILLSAVARMAGGWDAEMIAAVLGGSGRKKLIAEQLDCLSVYGLLAGEHTQKSMVKMLDVLVETKMLERARYGTLELSRFGGDVMSGRAAVWPQVAEAIEHVVADGAS